MPPTSRSHKPTKSVSKVEDVADGISNLKIRSKAAPTLTPADKLRTSMVTINDISQTLSSAVKSGWKLGSESDSEWSLDKIHKAMSPVPGALTTLRTVYKEQGKIEKLADVERAALGVVSKLNGLKVYTLALDLLVEIRRNVLALFGVEEVEDRPKSRAARTKAPAQQTHLHLLRLPVFPTSTTPSPSLQIALATFQAHSIKAVLATLTHVHLEELHALLTSPEFSLTRFPPASGILPTDQLSALYVGAFQAVAGSGALSPPPTLAPTTTTTRSTRATSVSRKTSGSSKSTPAAKSSPSPDELAFLVRKQALLILARSPSLEKDTDLFWDQALKWGAIYVKNVSASSSPPTESQITQVLSQFFTDLVSSVSVRGPRFEAMCEWWIRFAKKTKDTELIGKISGLLQGGDNEPRTPTRTHSTDAKAPPSEPTETRQTPAVLLATLDRASLSAGPEDMCAAADALLTLSRGTSADLSLSRRVSDLRKACAKCWTKDKDASRKVVKAIAPGFPPELTVSAVDALLALSRNELDTKDYETYEKAGEGVAKALTLAQAFSTRTDLSDETTYPTLLRAISNTGYTLAGALYNASRPTQAIGFVQQSCVIGEQALALADAQPGASKDKEIVALRDHMPRRWELLAICRLKATDRRGAVEAYGKALVWHVALLAPTELEKLDDKTSHFVSQLVVISVGDLFDPESVLLSRLFVNLDVEDKVVRLVMERVLGVLEDMMHKPVAQRAMELVVDELGRMWGDEYPIKRAK
ncbi:RNA-directed RNA polymerase L [Rhizoctonia solani]|uniref:RNA-directed RNA polymerase L n=1 Tax=Rhizoctonia solani TaxID=456999 RepID=A0A0K6FRG6_9AGAM|nr:RNA-directed RNA polymerase L [Rhizoctonia solani]